MIIDIIQGVMKHIYSEQMFYYILKMIFIFNIYKPGVFVKWKDSLNVF